MALSFLVSSNQTLDVVISCDPSVEADASQRSSYLETGDLGHLKHVGDDATKFTLKALSPSEREDAEARAGALTRSELGRLLWSEAPNGEKERAQWHHQLSDDERKAMSDYQAYLNRVYQEMIRSALVKINGEEANFSEIEMIRPESHRIQTISELVIHIQRISLLGIEGK